MKQVIQMAVVLTLICAVCGAALSGIQRMTAERIVQQTLMNVQGPNVKVVLEGAENDLIADRKNIEIDGEALLLFIGKKNDKPWAIAYETTSAGFGGDLTIMVGFDLEQDKLTGLKVGKNSETAGVGSRVTEDPFTKQFKGLDIDLQFTGGPCPNGVDAVSGATVSSTAVCEALKQSVALYPKVKDADLGQ
jgi:electron transport complex protein RnfG